MMNMRLGITGGIGAGKSVVSRLLRTMQIPVYDCDENAKRLLEQSEEIKSGLISLLGEESYIDGKLNRSFIASKIFSDKELLEKVNAIVHPIVFNDFEEWAVRQDSLIVGMESALILQSPLALRVLNKVCLVSAPQEIRIERAMKRDGAERDKVMQRVANQADDSEARRFADFVIVNDNKCSVIHQTRMMMSQLVMEMIG